MVAAQRAVENEMLSFVPDQSSLPETFPLMRDNPEYRSDTGRVNFLRDDLTATQLLARARQAGSNSNFKSPIAFGQKVRRDLRHLANPGST